MAVPVLISGSRPRAACWWMGLFGLLAIAALGLFGAAENHARLAGLAAAQHHSPRPVDSLTTDAEPQDGSAASRPTLQEPATDFITKLTQRAARHEVRLVRLDLGEQAPTTDALGRQTYSLTLRGSYSGTRRLIESLLDPAVSVGRLRMRSDEAESVLETQIVLSRWASPTESPSARTEAR